MNLFSFLDALSASVKVGDYIEFTSDLHSDKGPCTGSVVAISDTTYSVSHGDETIDYAKDDICFKGTWVSSDDSTKNVFSC